MALPHIGDPEQPDPAPVEDFNVPKLRNDQLGASSMDPFDINHVPPFATHGETGDVPPAVDPHVPTGPDVPGPGTDDISVPTLNTDLGPQVHTNLDATGNNPDQPEATHSNHTDVVDMIELPHLQIAQQYIDLL